MNFGEGFGFSACACRDSISDASSCFTFTGGTPTHAAVDGRHAAVRRPRAAMGPSPPRTPRSRSGAHNPAAEVSGDDRVTSSGALMIPQAAAGRIEL
ncbi:MAG: hypothetical protein U9Q68_04075 [Euryarchaeota archaeon]|nr:hypothetical protein [Euryarchaeota archaeon]